MDPTKEIAYYETVSDLYRALGIPIEQESQFSIHNLLDLHKTFPYVCSAYRTNYYSFLFIKEGSGNYTINENTYRFGSRTFFFTNPNHLKAFELYNLKEAYIITLSEEFLKLNVNQDVFGEFPFLLSETVSPQILEESLWNNIEQLYMQILDEANRTSTLKNKIIGNLLVVLLLKVKELFCSDYPSNEEGNNQSNIVGKFKKDLEQHFRDLISKKTSKIYQSQDYANLQHLNPNYFSQVIKNKTGKTPSQWIARKSITLAKSMLIHSSKSVKEISYSLGFSETAHFSNYFKKNAGIRPSYYRKMFNAERNDNIHNAN